MIRVYGRDGVTSFDYWIYMYEYIFAYNDSEKTWQTKITCLYNM